MSWAAYISSVDRLSYSPGTDPLYLTKKDRYYHRVKAGRPALSCWEVNQVNDLFTEQPQADWSLNGRSSTILNLNEDLGIPKSLAAIFVRYLGIPKVVNIGILLGQSALASSQFALGSLLDAGTSNMSQDLHRLILTSYIATTNTLTDTTLYPHDDIPNQALGKDQKPKPNVGDFVVFTPDVATLSVKNLAIIPVFSVLLAVTAFVLLKWTPLRSVKALDAVVLHHTLKEKYPEAWPLKDGVWKTGSLQDDLPLNEQQVRQSRNSRTQSEDYLMLPIYEPERPSQEPHRSHLRTPSGETLVPFSEYGIRGSQSSSTRYTLDGVYMVPPNEAQTQDTREQATQGARNS
ncbi:uncharacterized protein BCR38DRAFT_481472 [Pseudomassariella vexata]|uniref:Uncharacterized protein n=1 Tax=Pseudomassariella vexata TaxID=1141098 RepID=A0A1Y2EFH5_9PEZI|nr:uncharacterized protein BCR38DRAFT_481472 [Pseudomassariella vexata]ORY70338.1 hypothetical protein BCR38DRAFT_481472 [Pseudomassariella vexata]